MQGGVISWAVAVYALMALSSCGTREVLEVFLVQDTSNELYGSVDL